MKYRKIFQITSEDKKYHDLGEKINIRQIELFTLENGTFKPLPSQCLFYFLYKATKYIYQKSAKI